ncbi:MAG: GNAT family N-acetyltransferase [Bacilli bacterium]|nr:GNAT family N-acetyltransferase [Bacilli bacterium]
MILIVKTKDELIASYRIRKTVFIEEQHVAYEEEFDLDDDHYVVLLSYHEGIAVATARMRQLGSDLKVGRVATLQEYRHQGHAKALMEEAIRYGRNLHLQKVILDAQLTAIPFYEKIGFQTIGDIFLDANIEHKKMIYLL